jgi:hypothetical protein
MVTLTNQGSLTLTVTRITPTSSDFAATNNCTSLIPGASCTINVTFSPTAGGTRAGSLTIVDSDPSSPQLVSLSGTGTSGRVSLTPGSLDFGDQALWSTSAVQTLTLKNTGTAALEVLAITASGDYSSSNTCAAPLAPEASCSIEVKFAPSAAGTRTGFITVLDADPTSLHTVNLTGMGTVTASDVTVTPSVVSLNSALTQRFTALISGVPSSNVTWSVSGIVGGNSAVGTITRSGLYTPGSISGPHLIKAANKSNLSQFGLARVVVTNYVGTFTFHNDTMRTGQNRNEIVLTTGNVNATQFGKLFSYPVEGLVYAQPLYVPGVNIPAQGVHNVAYVATEHDSVYAFDADGLSSTSLWQVSFIDPAAGITTVPSDEVELQLCESIGREIGITGTPVIDPSSGTLYVLARTKEVSGDATSYVQRLHALDITSGAERPGSPVVIQASVAGSGEDSVNGFVAFDPKLQNSRVSLLLSKGVIYAGWASLCDIRPYHGWVLGYDADTLEQVTAFNTSPDSSASGVWQGGAGIAADSVGNLYFATANGGFDVPGGGREYGDTILKMSTGNGLSVADYFTPYTQQTLQNQDLDLGSGGVLLLPDQLAGPPHLLVQVDKVGTIYLVNRENMGHFNSTSNNQIVQSLSAVLGEMTGTPTYYRHQVYFWGANDLLKAYSLYRGLLSQAPVSRSLLVRPHYPGPMTTVSANGSANGILWVVDTNNHKTGGPDILRAYDAADVSRELYDSTQAGTRDQAGAAVRFAVPTVANGKVYVGTGTELDVYGLFSN